MTNHHLKSTETRNVEIRQYEKRATLTLLDNKVKKKNFSETNKKIVLFKRLSVQRL